MSARSSVSRSKPTPLTFCPEKPRRSRRNARSSWSMIATVCPASSKVWASVTPTRPHPMMTKWAMQRSPLVVVWQVWTGPDGVSVGRCRVRGYQSPTPRRRGPGAVAACTPAWWAAVQGPAGRAPPGGPYDRCAADGLTLSGADVPRRAEADPGGQAIPHRTAETGAVAPPARASPALLQRAVLGGLCPRRGPDHAGDRRGLGHLLLALGRRRHHGGHAGHHRLVPAIGEGLPLRTGGLRDRQRPPRSARRDHRGRGAADRLRAHRGRVHVLRGALRRGRLPRAQRPPDAAGRGRRRALGFAE